MRHPRDLHSFPTRRSSDLHAPERHGRNDRSRPSLRQRPNRCNQRRRSEEHTSELQSPCNLVCRLLLEKKKKQWYINEDGTLTTKLSFTLYFRYSSSINNHY